MDHHSTPAVALVAGRPIYATLAQFPIVCFTLTLLTDLAYWQTSNLLWHNFSAWLLFAGLVFGGLALIVGAVEFLVRPAVRALRPGWLYALGSAVVLVLAFVNSLVHAGDGWTAIVPYGLILSAVTVVVMIVTDRLDRGMVYRHGVVVADHD